ncbi:MAG: TlpA disulfide reductase family protein [Gammaproteobacteria bacterium]|nr:TlpA disulfide reductase family protein [Gammaproteobacteria bacterium]MDD9895598.1 TlpA disulfide reductase family protein [Gammaproteobacteria bacterium]MDD9959705.1 TlpA disulfide reductase family protein [Gammaproteobacteria bacterium]
MPYRFPTLYKKMAVLAAIVGLGYLVYGQEYALDFEGNSIYGDGATLRLSDQRGKVVYLDFWASWCPPCLQSLPAYDQMYQEIGNEQFELIAINVDEDSEDGLFFLEDYPVSYPVLADPEGDIGIPYGLRSLPVSYLIDQEGRIIESYRSYSPGDEVELKQKILELINQ